MLVRTINVEQAIHWNTKAYRIIQTDRYICIEYRSHAQLLDKKTLKIVRTLQAQNIRCFNKAGDICYTSISTGEQYLCNMRGEIISIITRDQLMICGDERIRKLFGYITVDGKLVSGDDVKKTYQLPFYFVAQSSVVVNDTIYYVCGNSICRFNKREIEYISLAQDVFPPNDIIVCYIHPIICYSIDNIIYTMTLDNKIEMLDSLRSNIWSMDVDDDKLYVYCSDHCIYVYSFGLRLCDYPIYNDDIKDIVMTIYLCLRGHLPRDMISEILFHM